MQLNDTFCCEKLKASGVTLNACIGRQISMTVGSNPNFLCFMGCEQGAKHKAAFPHITIKQLKKHISLHSNYKKKSKEMRKIMGAGKLIITHHAKERFTERFFAIYPDFGGDIDKKLMKLLSAAKPEKLDALKRLSRLQKHSDTEYYATDCGWRFVVAVDEEGLRKLVTSERICRLQNREATNVQK